MAKPEIRMSEKGFIVLMIVVVAVIAGAATNWYGLSSPSETVPQVDEDGNPAALQLIPAIEKTKIYLTTFDQADFEGEGQQNRIAGTVDLIKSGNVIDTVTTLTTGGAASTAEFNGGDKVIALADASGYYAAASEQTTIEETLQPIAVALKAAGTPDVSIQDDNGDAASAMVLDANEVSKRHTLVVERPGDDSWYQLCGIAADYDDEKIIPRVKVAGSYEDGMTNLDEEYDALDTLGYDAVWNFEESLKDFDELEIDFLVGTEKDVNPSGDVISFVAFDCEDNLQNGVIVTSSEDSADNDVGLANIAVNVTVN